MAADYSSFSISEYEELFMTHYVSLTQTAYRLLKDKGAAEDAVQEVFCKLWEKRAELEITTSLKAYLFQMVIHRSLNQLKKNKTLQVRESEYSNLSHRQTDTTHDHLNFKDAKKRVEQAVNTLPPTCRIAFILSRYEEMRYKEIAAELEISVKAVENHIMKALRHLRQVLVLLLFLKIYS
ncbi:MAG: RNA polymerase sigma-70 factor [Chitinophagaceae bacterium]|nr:RNA polymerase sigma-70 factor [Chitinophagaceae bacterium]